mmetsp:Transcript_11515/g.26426  ORF Transcript_11515/g.26426 Transcript_11515/m.26426 type:complete len:223 (-) Transcript_11515:180-848(-)
MMKAGASPHWESMWSAGLRRGQAFDVGAASATLHGCLSRHSFATRPGMKALVPGCGRAYDALALARHGFEEVVALDLAPTAVAAAQEYLKSEADTAATAKVRCTTGDFFEHMGQYDFIWDCTFLCALDPSVREQWATQQRRLLAPGGVLASCVFPICEKDGGPPYALTPQLVRGLLETTGLVCESVEVSDAERHRPGGAGSLGGAGGPGTALLLAHAALGGE